MRELSFPCGCCVRVGVFSSSCHRLARVVKCFGISGAGNAVVFAGAMPVQFVMPGRVGPLTREVLFPCNLYGHLGGLGRPREQSSVSASRYL